MKIVIIGGVAGGAACATRLRRLDEHSEITVLERGPHPSFANCGLPYYLGGIIEKRDDLFMATTESLKERFNINVLTAYNAIKIDREHKYVVAEHDGKQSQFSYDRLIIATGAHAVIPSFAKKENIFTLRSVEDVDAIDSFITNHHPARVLVIGGGFIGLEAAENLHKRGIDVTIVEAQKNVMTGFSEDLAFYIEERLKDKGIHLYAGKKLLDISSDKQGLHAVLSDYSHIDADFAVLSIGIRPNSQLAEDCGLALSASGHIVTNENMQTSDSSIYALGDVAAIRNRISGEISFLALAGPISKQVRAVCGDITGQAKPYTGFIGTSTVKLFDLEAARTGLTYEQAKEESDNACRVWTHMGFRPGYIPFTTTIHLCLIFNKKTGTIFGAQAVGGEGTVKAIDGIGTIMGMGGTVHDLAEREHAYQPLVNLPRDPVCMLGAIAENVVDGLNDVCAYDELKNSYKDAFLLDVRTKSEFSDEHYPGFINIELDKLRDHLDAIPHDRDIVVTCKIGQRAYLACRILRGHGFTRVYDLSGGVTTLKAAGLLNNN